MRISRAGRNGRQDNKKLSARPLSTSPLRRTSTHDPQRTRPMSTSPPRRTSSDIRTHTGQSSTSESSTVANATIEQRERGPRKPSMAPRQHTVPKQMCAASLLNHSLLGDSSCDLDMSSTVDVSGTVRPNRRRTSSMAASTRSSVSQHSNGSQRSKSFSRNTHAPGETTRSKSQPKSTGKTKSLAENVGKEGRSAAPENRRSHARRTASSEDTSPSGKTSPAKGGEKKSRSPEPPSTGSIRRTRSMTRAADAKKPSDGHAAETVEKIVTVMKAAHSNLTQSTKRALSQPPAPSTRTAPFPANTACSTSPTRSGGRDGSPPKNLHGRTSTSSTSRSRSTSPSRTADRDGSPSKSRHGRTSPSSKSRARPTSPSQSADRDGRPSSCHGRTSTSLARSSRPTRRTSPSSRSEARSASPSNSAHHRRTSPSRDDQPTTPKRQERPILAPPSGVVKRESMTLANAFDVQHVKGLDPDDGDSSASEATDDGTSVVWQFNPANTGSVTSFKRDSSYTSLSNSGVFKMANLSEQMDSEEMDDDSGGSYLPNGIDLGQKPKPPGRPVRDGQVRRRQSRRQSHRKRSPCGDRERANDRRQSLERRESLTIDKVFAQPSAADSNLGRSKLGSLTDSSASFGGHASDLSKSKGRGKVQERLKHKPHNPNEEKDDDITAGSAYLPSNMTGPNLTPPGSPRRLAAANLGRPSRSSSHGRQSRSSSRHGKHRISESTKLPAEPTTDERDDGNEQVASAGVLLSDDEDSDDGDEGNSEMRPVKESKRKKALKFVKGQLKSRKGKAKGEIGHSSPTRAEPSEEQGSDSHIKNGSFSADKSVGKKLKGLFGRNEKKHHLLGSSGESDSEDSFDVMNN